VTEAECICHLNSTSLALATARHAVNAGGSPTACGRGTVPKADAVDVLWTIATAHALVRAMGEDDVQGIIAEAFVSLTQDIAA
jgi:hypothetical protein